MPERGKALFRHYCVFLLENPVFGMDGFILLAEREAFCNKFDRFYLNHKVIFDYLFKSSYMPV